MESKIKSLIKKTRLVKMLLKEIISTMALIKAIYEIIVGL